MRAVENVHARFAVSWQRRKGLFGVVELHRVLCLVLHELSMVNALLEVLLAEAGMLKLRLVEPRALLARHQLGYLRVNRIVLSHQLVLKVGGVSLRRALGRLLHFLVSP